MISSASPSRPCSACTRLACAARFPASPYLGINVSAAQVTAARARTAAVPATEYRVGRVEDADLLAAAERQGAMSYLVIEATARGQR